MAQVGIIMGSQSDLPIMEEAIAVLKEFNIETEVDIVSAHRTPEKMMSYGSEAHKRGLKVIIAGAGGAAHLRIERQPRVEVELPAEFDLGAGERIFIEAGDLGGTLREAQREDRLEFNEVFRFGQPGIDLLQRDRAVAGHAGGE